MKNRNILILILFLLTFTLYFFNNIFSDILLITFLILGLDLSSDAIFDQIGKNSVPGFNYGFLVLGFVTSLDEIFVAVGSILSGAPDIGSGALLGSSFFMIVIYSILMLVFGYKLNMKHPYYFVVFPFFLIVDSISFSLSVNLIPLYFISIIVSLLILYLVLEGWGNHVWKINRSQIKTSIFLIPLLMFALLLSIATDRFSGAVRIDQFLSGFLIPGILGTVPETVVVYSSLKNRMPDASEGLLTGSTLIKGTLLFPIFEIFFYTSREFNFGSVLISAVVSLVFSFYIFSYKD